jgi:hypothetical protein
MTGVVISGLLTSIDARGQTPEQQKLWEAQHSQTIADEKAQAGQLNRERAARRADPMAWVRTLDPMLAGGWEFRAVAADGAWAAYSTDHQMKRSGKLETVWLRQEFAEPQTAPNGRYLSVVEKVQYDCGKARVRPLLIVYYSDNNIHGVEQTEENDEKNAPWNAIVPGTREELNFLWSCGPGKGASKD